MGPKKATNPGPRASQSSREPTQQEKVYKYIIIFNLEDTEDSPFQVYLILFI